jgi:glucuronokinase
VRPSRGRAFARAALAGNPSDGYGGKTLAVIIPEFVAEATVIPAAADRLVAPGPGGERLLRAALARFRADVGPVRPVEIRCETQVPREVGLAGSSAIIIAVLRSLTAATAMSLTPGKLALMALEIETEDLGIAAGLQDRLVQAHETLLQMDFGPAGGVEALNPGLLPDLYVAWSAKAAAPSGRIHAALRERWHRGDPELHEGMAELARQAGAARDALLGGEPDRFARAVDASLDARRRLMPVDRDVIRMADIARRHGACANSAGSGGAIVGALAHTGTWPALSDTLQQAGFETVRVHPEG